MAVFANSHNLSWNAHKMNIRMVVRATHLYLMLNSLSERCIKCAFVIHKNFSGMYCVRYLSGVADILAKCFGRLILSLSFGVFLFIIFLLLFVYTYSRKDMFYVLNAALLTWMFINSFFYIL